MLIQNSPDAYEKLRHLGGMATDDVLAPTDIKFNVPREAYSQPRNRTMPAGVYKAAMPNGKTVSLMRVMFTDVCKYDCAYCPNSHWVPRKRYGFKVDELAKLFMELYQRQTVAGLFLSSGIASTPDGIMEKLLDTVDALRNRYRFKGYIHLKVMPGTSPAGVEAAYRLGTRLSINLELPTQEHLAKVSTMKDFNKHMLEPMQAIHNLIQEDGKGTAVGQVTQLVVGAAEESDQDIYHRMAQLYGQWGFKRVYYQPFRPARYTPLEEHPATPMLRAHRLYQLDWLSRIYGYTETELAPAFDQGGFLPLDLDPKLLLAAYAYRDEVVDVNHAEYQHLIRVPGVGPTAAKRIVEQRKRHSINTWRDLQAMGVVAKRARAFLGFPSYKPEKSAQMKLDLFQEHPTPAPVPAAPAATAHAGGCSSCATAACGSCPIAMLRPTAAQAA
ncbi:MAG: helix-hairpin-helix domain-containing protein [Chloroflexi bacterium]|nr:helix-hairpin-helix domain-containing protein [Chloroflexota bacterium]